VRRGVTDPKRVAVGGHSYGAFMTANLLAHLAALPRRHRPQRRLQPHAHALRFPVGDAQFLAGPRSPTPRCRPSTSPTRSRIRSSFIHGEADNNSGTFPIQSERFYNALKGQGATTRLVLLPHEAHGYRARESLLHMLWERKRGWDAYVKIAPVEKR